MRSGQMCHSPPLPRPAAWQPNHNSAWNNTTSFFLHATDFPIAFPQKRGMVGGKTAESLKPLEKGRNLAENLAEYGFRGITADAGGRTIYENGCTNIFSLSFPFKKSHESAFCILFWQMMSDYFLPLQPLPVCSGEPAKPETSKKPSLDQPSLEQKIGVVSWDTIAERNILTRKESCPLDFLARFFFV